MAGRDTELTDCLTESGFSAELSADLPSLSASLKAISC